MAGECKIHVTGFVDIRGIMRDPEKPAGVQVGYKSNRAFTNPSPEVVEMVLTFGQGIAIEATIIALGSLIYKHASKTKSDKITVAHKIVAVDQGEITKAIKDHLK